MLKYSLGKLFLVMALVGVGCAAVANYSDVWAEAMVTLTVVMLLLAVLVAVFGRPNIRPFAAGFAIVGWTYFLLTFVEAAGVRDELLTTRAVDRLYGWKQRASVPPANESGGGFTSEMAGGYESMDPEYGVPLPQLDDLFNPPASAAPSNVDGYGTSSGIGRYGYRALPGDAPPALHDIGHALWTLVLALAGGVAAQAIDRMSRKREAAA